MDRLIAETQDNLARGYKIVEEERDGVFIGASLCSGGTNVAFCTSSVPPTIIRREVAIDPQSEQRKLESLRSKRSSLALRSCVG